MFTGRIEIPMSNKGQQYEVEARSVTGTYGYEWNGVWKLNSDVSSQVANIKPISLREYILTYSTGARAEVIIPRIDIREAYRKGVFQIIKR